MREAFGKKWTDGHLVPADDKTPKEFEEDRQKDEAIETIIEEIENGNLPVSGPIKDVIKDIKDVKDDLKEIFKPD